MNYNKYRNYLTTVRCDDSMSALYGTFEKVFIDLGNGKGSGDDKEAIYQLDGARANLMTNFNTARNNMMLLSKGNFDEHGNTTLRDKQNRPIYIGEGLIPQVERYANKYAYNNLSTEVFNTMISMLAEKSDKETGNHYMVLCNSKLWQDVNLKLGQFLSDNRVDGTHLWSKAKNDYISVGATYNTYIFAGNSVTFAVERALTREYGNKGYGLCLDLTANSANGMPPISMMTLKGQQCVQNYIKGPGGFTGGESGEVSTPVAGSKLIIWGLCGICVWNPYKSFIIREA